MFTSVGVKKGRSKDIMQKRREFNEKKGISLNSVRKTERQEPSRK